MGSPVQGFGPLRPGRVLKLPCWLFGHLFFAHVSSGGVQGVLPEGLVQCHGFESAKLVSAFLFCLAKD